MKDKAGIPDTTCSPHIQGAEPSLMELKENAIILLQNCLFIGSLGKKSHIF